MEKYTIQGILQDHLQTVRQSRPFPLYQLQALSKLTACRTASLGGHVQRCEDGHLNGIWYNSCKNRSCPQCRGRATEEWLRNTQSLLLDCPHHHCIFTFPQELNTLWRFNRGLFTELLFQATKETLRSFSDDPRYLGATPGIITTLHTWGRSMPLHPHLHVLISHGGLDQGGRWVDPPKSILFPQKAVMRTFRGKLLAAVRKALTTSSLVLPADNTTTPLLNLLNKLGRKEWVVHFCKRYDYADGVAKYLSRYIKGGPINNSQIVCVSEGRVTFRYKSHQTGRLERLKLSIEAFIERFSQHIPAPGKMSTRYSGLYNSAMRGRLGTARAAHGQAPVRKPEKLAWQAFMAKGDKLELPVCGTCGKPLRHAESVPRISRHQ